jgi:hypothetical protein
VARKGTIFWDIPLCSILKVNRRFGGLSFPGSKSKLSKKPGSSACSSILRWRRCSPSNRLLNFSGLQCVAFQKAVLYPRRLVAGLTLRWPGFDPESGHIGFMGDKVALGSLLRALRFPLPVLIQPSAPCSSLIRGWYNRPISDRRTMWTQSHPTLRN